MTLEQDAAVLAQIKIFRYFSQDHIKMLVFAADRRVIPSGKSVCRAGKPAPGGIAILRGELCCTEDRPKGFRTHWTQSMIIAEAALIAQVDYPLTVRAVSDAEILLIPRHVFHRLLHAYPQVATSLLQRYRASLSQFARDLLRSPDGNPVHDPRSLHKTF